MKFFHSLFKELKTGASSDSSRVHIWDGWRGVAILLVLCGHFYDIGWVWEDRMGVDVFFGLSGMLMSVILFEKRMSLRDFYIRRFSRIFPVFFVCVVVMFAFAFVVSLPFSWAELLASLTFMRTYLPHSPGIFESGPTVHHLWSLNVEEHAYVFLSLLTLLFVNRKFIATVLLLVGLALVALAVYRYTQMSVADYRLYLIRTESAVVFILFSAGYGLLARRHGISVPAALPVVCLILAFFCYAEAAPLWLIIAICPVLLAVTVNHLNDMPALLKSVLSNSILRHFGFWSYSIYLWQQIFFQYHWRFSGGKFTAVLLAVLTGIVSYYFLEQPTRRWINSKWSPKPCYRAG